MAKYYLPAVLLVVALCSGCASVSNRKGGGESAAGQPPVYRFVGQGIFSEVRRGDQQIEFSPIRIVLSNTQLLLIPSLGQNQEAEDIRFPLRDLKGAALFPGAVTHSNQLQLIYKKTVLVIHVTDSRQTNNDARTARLHELLVAEGVRHWKSEQLYYVGMDLSKPPKTPSPVTGFFSAAGKQIGKMIWGAIKGAVELVISPIIPF